MATQTDGVLIRDWASFAQEQVQQYLGAKLQAKSVLPSNDSKVVSAAQTPQTPPSGIGAFLTSPMGIGVAVVGVLAVVYLLKKL
jgi:hypothetical protein